MPQVNMLQKETLSSYINLKASRKTSLKNLISYREWTLLFPLFLAESLHGQDTFIVDLNVSSHTNIVYIIFSFPNMFFDFH